MTATRTQQPSATAPAEPTLGTRVRDARLAAGLTQSALAGERFSKEYVSQIERGATVPRRTTLEWLAARLDTDVELLQSIRSGSIGETRVGAYLRSLTTRFPGPVVADMLCLLRIHAELSIRAKGLLLAREAGLPAEVGPDVRANLEELRYLEKEIGKTGLLAMSPVRRQTSRDLWQIHVLSDVEATNGRVQSTDALS